MKITEYNKRLMNKLFLKLERKTGWGKEEIKKEFNISVMELNAEIIDELDETTELGKQIRSGNMEDDSENTISNKS